MHKPYKQTTHYSRRAFLGASGLSGLGLWGSIPGAVGGAVLGGIIGKAVTKKDKGAAVGALIGGAIANENQKTKMNYNILQ